MKMLCAKILFLLSLIFGIFPSAQAAIEVGDPANIPDGNPLNCGNAANPCDTIQNGIDVAPAGETLNIAAQSFVENIVVNKPLTLQGAGQGNTFIFPKDSNYDCSVVPESSLCGGTVTNIILVRSDNVTIHDLTIDGDNTNLSSGFMVNGADIDARNGIITDNSSPLTFDNLTVFNVTAKNIFLRGIYASNGGTFNFHDNIVQNVAGGPYSIGIFNYGGSGIIQNNLVENSNDGIASNWSSGVQFLNNQIVQSGSGVHTDNSGGSQATLYPNAGADLIQGNQISNCNTNVPNSNTVGVFVFYPEVAPLVQNNQVTNCQVGFAVFGKRNANVTPSFTSNIANSNNIGALLTTAVSPTGGNPLSSNVSAIFISNTMTNNGDGFMLEAQSGFELSLNANFNRIAGNGNSGASLTPSAQGTYAVNMENNWWGCNAGPNNPAGACDQVVGDSIDFGPWLVLRLTADPTTISEGGTSALVADLNSNSNGENVSAQGSLPNGTNLTFATDFGNIGAAPGVQATEAGAANRTYSASEGPGTATVSVTLDQQTVPATITIIQQEVNPEESTPTPSPSSGNPSVVQGGGISCSMQPSASPQSSLILWAFLPLTLFSLARLVRRAS